MPFSSLFFFVLLDKKGVDTRLQGAQNTLLLQEETIRRSERERKTMLDQIAGLERQLIAMENEKKQLLVGFLEDFLDKKQMIDKFLGKNGCIKIK
jgi:hypothetical protein